MADFPQRRLRRLRSSQAMRELLAENRLHPADLILPVFVCEGTGEKQPIAAMPNVYRWSADRVTELAQEAHSFGIKALLLFGVVDRKDALGLGLGDPTGPVVQAIELIRRAAPHLVLMADLCLCDYADHGHCGVLTRSDRRYVSAEADATAHRNSMEANDFVIDNDATLKHLAEGAVVLARAGADVIAPSDMMDGRVGAIRSALDRAGFCHVAILSYAVKFASAFYGPFRNAADNAPRQGPTHRRSYQLNPANLSEGLLEARLDEREGADMLMVKPALAYLDVIRAVREQTHLPVVAYNVSGEYAWVKTAASAGLADETTLMMEVLSSIRRAGAGPIISYHAMEAAKILRG